MQEIILQTKHPVVPTMAKHQHMCLECDFNELIGYYGKDYALAFCEGFICEYDRKYGQTIADRLRMKGLTDMYAKFGITFERIEVTDWKRFAEHLCTEIRAFRPIIVHFDCFFADWDPLYRKKHNNHTVLIVGIKDGAFFISDSFFGVKRWVAADIMQQASTFYYDVNVTDACPISQDAYKNEFLRIYHETEDSNYFSSMLTLAEDIISTDIDIKDQEIEFDIWCSSSKIIQAIRSLELNKSRFQIFLNEWENLEGHNNYSEYYSDVLMRWRSFRTFLYKTYCRSYPSDMLTRLSEHLKRIIQAERFFFDRIYQLIAKRKDAWINTFTALDIKELCNNKGLSVFVDDETADFTDMEEFLYVAKTKSKIERYGYLLAVGQEKDNILCEGQKIGFAELGNAEIIKLLICGEWGNYTVKFGMEYSDGSQERLEVYVRDWVIEEEGRILIGQSVVRENARNKILNKELFGDELIIPVDGTKRVQAIILPACLNVHVLSICIKTRKI